MPSTPDDMLDGAAEGRLIGVTRATVSRARTRYTSHPANSPAARVDRMRDFVRVLAPRADIIAWWPPTGSGLSPAGWQYLRSVAAGTPDVELGTSRVRSLLRAKGLLDEHDQLTEQAKTLLAAPTSETT